MKLLVVDSGNPIQVDVLRHPVRHFLHTMKTADDQVHADVRYPHRALLNLR